MDQEFDQRLQNLEKKVDETHAMVRKIWNIYKWGMWITIVLIVLPAIGLAFAIPAYLKAVNFNSLIQ